GVVAGKVERRLEPCPPVLIHQRGGSQGNTVRRIGGGTIRFGEQLGGDRGRFRSAAAADERFHQIGSHHRMRRHVGEATAVLRFEGRSELPGGLLCRTGSQ